MGGNLTSTSGSPIQTLACALKSLNRNGIQLCAVSRFFQTPSFPEGAGPDYVNAAVCIKTALSARELLQRLHEIEAEFGRERVQRWGMRTLDLDLIAYGEQVLPDRDTQASWRALPIEEQIQQSPGELILPHPRVQDRAFVLGPLCDIAQGWRHPLLGRTFEELYAQLPQSDRDALISL
ncbi:2-amino-4-hydroxy-6-hydroxymethyldihydropteridine diphosphokinase [Shimia sp.]|uniref:2-amino-4-hydroxy-6- hydroxymethyldihydropteridine diphosphokinase n=1 Tax=Shimia sp. TaxID=1954381 RepID=UPI003297BEB6